MKNITVLGSIIARHIYQLSLAILCVATLALYSCDNSSGKERKDISGINDIKKDCVIGVQLGTTSDILATELEKEGQNTRVDRYTKSADAIQALLQGKIDCMVGLKAQKHLAKRTAWSG